MNHLLRALPAVFVLLFSASSCAGDSGQPPSGSAGADRVHTSESPTTTGAAGGSPPEVTEHAGGWPVANRDHLSSRAVLSGPISSATVASLGEAWRYELPGGSSFGNAATNPIVVGDTVYVSDLTTIVHALDLDSGEGIWTAGRVGSLFGPTGVSVGWGKVFATKAGENGRGRGVVAYDMESGTELWVTDITPAGGEVNVQTSAFGGLVFASSSGFGAHVRGSIWALDQETGEVVWTFHTIESEDLWGNPDVNSGGGVWYPPTIDAEAGIAYFGVGNPYPFPGVEGFPNGSSRPGDNRWTNSTVALGLSNGELIWGFQAFPHDLFDRDHVITALADTPVGGVLISTGKGGVVFGLDASTGEQLWRRPVGEHLNDEVDELTGPLEVLPGAQGGVLTPIAVADGLAYVAVNNAPIVYQGPEVRSTGGGTALGTRPGNIVALDASTGDIVWDVKVDGDPLGGVTVVNDIVFTATLQGRIIALERATGAQLWTLQTDGRINGWPAVVGDTIIWPIGIHNPAYLLALRLHG